MLDVLSLYTRTGLAALDAQFCDHLKTADTALYNRLLTARAEPAALDAKAEGDLLLALAPHLDDFIAGVFGIRAEVTALQEQHTALAPLFAAKRLFVQRVALKKYKAEDAAGFNGEALRRELQQTLTPTPLPVRERGSLAADTPLSLTGRGAGGEGHTFGEGQSSHDIHTFELALARAILNWQEDDAENAAKLDLAARYCAFASINPPADSVLFRHPHKLDAENLVPVESTVRDGVTMYKLPDQLLRARYGFDLTDNGFSLEAALDQANYCIWCQHQGKDSCSKGLKDKKTGAFQQNQHKVTLAGCPLEEHISEMNEAKAAGHVIGALGIITINNPMCAGTGHRICNDCMKSCIYQKQEPVNIPAIETRTLDDVLHLPYGFEIYSLLTRWNPLNIRRPLPLKDSGYKVLVAGLGPAGYTLAHHLMNDGHTVVGIDGLKIEPLAPALSGVDAYGARHAFEPIKDITSIYENLGERTPAGFGGVAEYGITVRWNKNYLKVIRLLLERRAQFTMIGGVRFGGTVTVESAFSMGFDHVALCLGAGKPTLIDMDNKLARGVRQASDFLMALQLSGAAKADSLANLTVRLPIVVIGGGLTAIDTATESLAYYSVQVEKFLTRFEAMDSAAFLAGLNPEERETADEWLDHARQLRAARARGEDTIHLLQAWGGSTLAYRRRLQDAPSYTLNHEEVHKALEEGIFFAENLTPRKVELDERGAAIALVCKDANGADKRLPARTILVAAGTQPNTVLAREETFLELDGKYFRAVDADGETVHPERLSKPATPQVLMHKTADSRFVSFFGDLHPSFAGNVVKAMGSAKQGYSSVSAVLRRRAPSAVTAEALRNLVNTDWRARVHRVTRLTPTIVDVEVLAPAAARAFEPGQFYRLQNFEALAERRNGTMLAMEGLALTGASVDKERGILSTIVLEMGGSSNLCATLKPGEPIILMGPTGAPTEIPRGENVLLAGGGVLAAVLAPLAAAAALRIAHS